MINPHKISMAIKKQLKWLIFNNYGRLVLGLFIALSGVIFSIYVTIAGMIIIVFQVLWNIIRTIYLWLQDKSD